MGERHAKTEGALVRAQRCHAAHQVVVQVVGQEHWATVACCMAAMGQARKISTWLLEPELWLPGSLCLAP